jgi:predicted ribosome quality control (RQC) complex YloA/Tae2 family protein
VLWAFIFSRQDPNKVTDPELHQIAAEINSTLGGRKFGRVFSLSRTAVAIDFHPHNGAYLFIDIAPRWRAIYLIVRKLKILERESVNPTPFQITLRQALSGFDLVNAAAASEGIILQLQDASGHYFYLYAAVNASPANLVLFDEERNVTVGARDDGAVTMPPMPQHVVSLPPADGVESLSAELDRKRNDVEAANRFDLAASEARKSVVRNIAKRNKLLTNLDGDLAKHGDAEQWKRFGDLVLASMPSLKREGEHFRLVDLFDPDQPEILIPASDDSPKLVAEKYYKAYRKAINARDVIERRKEDVKKEIDELSTTLGRIDQDIERKDLDAILAFLKPKERIVERSKNDKNAPAIKGVRRFASSEGFEILVGKKSTDNDMLTFRIARSLDTWLHAADYPGSHVVIRNPNRKPIPHSTLIEAASLAAFYSDARELPKAAVNYTEKKFVNKQKRAAPGLVSLASFKTVIIKPEVPSTVEKSEA